MFYAVFFPNLLILKSDYKERTLWGTEVATMNGTVG